jgi:hypothetical protein
MPCNVNLNGSPTIVVDEEPLSTPITSEEASVPNGADCVTFTFELCPNAGQISPNQVEIRIFWTAAGGVPTTQESVLQQTATCGEFDTCFTVYLSPTATDPDCVAWDLSLSVPAGKSGVFFTATEVGDPANPGTLSAWVSFK